MILAAALFSTGGAAIKASTLSGPSIACLRSGIAAITLLAALPAARRGWSASTWLVGAAYGATMILFVIANKLTTAASAIFLQSTAPLYILLLAPWLLRESLERRDAITMAVLTIGMTLFFIGTDPAFSTAPDPRRGNLAGAFCGLTWALTLMGLRSTARVKSDGSGREGAVKAVVAGNLIACLATLPWLPAPSDLTPQDALLVVYLGVFQIGVAYILLTSGIGGVGALSAALLLLAEPALSPVWAWAAHGETPGALSLTGGVVILAATTGRAVAARGRAAAGGSS